MKIKIKRDLKARFLYSLFELDRVLLQLIYLNQILPLNLRLKAHRKLSKLPSITKIRNICSVTGRTRGLIKNFKVSRLVFRNLADSGMIWGVKRK